MKIGIIFVFLKCFLNVFYIMGVLIFNDFIVINKIGYYVINYRRSICYFKSYFLFFWLIGFLFYIGIGYFACFSGFFLVLE